MRVGSGLVVLSSLAMLVTGCGGGPPSADSVGRTVSVTFTGGAPAAVATQVGGGAFVLRDPGDQVTVPVPAGNTMFSVAYVCPQSTVPGNPTREFVIETTTQDGMALTADCGLGLSSRTAAATGNVSSTIPGTANLGIFGKFGLGGALSPPSASGSFNMLMPVGSNDIAAIAVDGSTNIVGVKIVRSQTVPGTVSAIALQPSDATTTQNLTVANVPPGFGFPPFGVTWYYTAGGTQFLLTNTAASMTNPTPYSVIPAGSAQPGDFYFYWGSTASPSGQRVEMTQTTTSGGGPFTLTLPSPLTMNAPAPAKFPTFTFTYSGFSGLPAVAESGTIYWSTGPSTTSQIAITATANFQNGSNAITIPDLTSLPGFLVPAPSGTTINWFAAIYGGTVQVFNFTPNPPANGSLAVASQGGTFIQP